MRLRDIIEDKAGDLFFMILNKYAKFCVTQKEV